MYIYICIHTQMYVCVYIYIYASMERTPEAELH